MLRVVVRAATPNDLEAILAIYNQGIEDRLATLETAPKELEEMQTWYDDRDGRYAVVVASLAGAVVGWASLNRFTHRCAHAAIADLSVYVERSHRGKGVGSALLAYLEPLARAGGFHKIVLHALERNAQGKALYRKAGFGEVGVFKEHGAIDDHYVDVVAMEKLL